MNLISRISRIFVVYCALFALSGGADAFAADGFEIRTARGKVYRNCKVLKADPHGLSFRHSNGVAKIAFEDLDQSLQKKYNYKKEEAEEFIRAHDAPSAPALPAMIQPIPLPGFSASMAPMIQASLPYAYTYPPVYWGSGGAYYGSAGYGSTGYGNPAYVAYQRNRHPGSFWGLGHGGMGTNPYLHGSLGYDYSTRLHTAGRTMQRGSNVAPALTSYAQVQDRQVAAVREQYRHSHPYAPLVYNYLMRSHLPTIKGGPLHQAIGVQGLTNHYYGQAGVNYINNRLSRAALNTATAHLARTIRPIRGHSNNARSHYGGGHLRTTTFRPQHAGNRGGARMVHAGGNRSGHGRH